MELTRFYFVQLFNNKVVTFFFKMKLNSKPLKQF